MSLGLTRINRVLLRTGLIFAIGVAPIALGDITGFGDGSNWALTGYDQDAFGNVTSTNDPATITSGVLHITGQTQAQARSAFYNAPQSLSAFTASFTFQNLNDSPLGPTDGFSFVVQSQSLTAVGGTGSGLGFTINGSSQPPSGPAITAIAPGAAEEFYLRNGTGATDFGVNGSGSFSDATPTDPVDLADGDRIQVTLTYNQATFTLSETLVDLDNPTSTYTLTRSADIDDVVGATGFVGFTGATGGAYSDGLISNFTFTAATPEPASIALLALTAAPLLTRRRRASL